MKVELLNHMGNDLEVVNAARVSFDKESKWELYAGDQKVDGSFFEELRLPEKDARLIHYLVEHDHWSPFSHVVAKFRVKAPIVINHQLWKSHIGAATQDDICGWNGVSRRYVDDEPEFFSPDMWRERAENLKQGSGDKSVFMMMPDDFGYTCRPETAYQDAVKHCLHIYKWLLASGVCPEQARIVLPQSMMTTWVWTGSLAFWARLFKLRMHPDAQEECKPVVLAIGQHMKELFPISWEALTGK